jgi:hypothetical protein
MSDPKKALSELLDRLETKAADGYGRMSFQGKAVGKSDDSLHVAVESGIVSIPLSEIEELRPIPGRSATEVLVDVANGDRIKHLRRVPDGVHGFPAPIPDGGPLVWPGTHGPQPRPQEGRGFPFLNMGSEASSSTGDCTGIDTTCASGGVADQTDDYRSYCWHDTD